MDSTFSLIFICLGFFLSMVVFLDVGKRFGLYRLAKDPDGARSGSGTIEGSIFALLGLLIAFTFSGAASRFDIRRQHVIDEANHIGTAYLRLDLLPESDQKNMRESFRQYLDARLATYDKLPDLAAAYKELTRCQMLQKEIWIKAVAACKAKSDPATTTLVLSAINQMIDITTTRAMASHMHPPTIVFILLFGLGLGCSLLAGYGMTGSKSRNWFHMLGFAAIMAITVYVILDIEYPRLGLIRVDAVDEVMIALRKTMN